MPAAPRPFSHEELLRHREWVRALAFALTDTRADAEDVEQETWLAALRSPPAAMRSETGWLATVARNAARKLRRGESRRRARERATWEASAQESAHAVAARAETHARVVEAVLALPETYRDTVLLRFFEGLPVAEVARRTGAPLETARARLRRAKELLRERLGEGDGNRLRSALGPVLLAAPRGRGGGAAAAGGSVAMGTAGKAAVAAAVVVAAGVGVWAFRAEPQASEPSGMDVAVATPVRAAVEPEPAPRPERVRAQVELAPEPMPEEANREQGPPIEERLDVEIEAVEFASESLLTVLATLQERSGIPFWMHPQIQADGIDRLPLTLKMSAMAPRKLLPVITMLAGVRWETREVGVVILPREEVDPSVELVRVARPAPRPRTHLVVRVEDPTGAPVSGATVSRAREEPKRLGETDASGALEVELEAPWGHLVAHKDSMWQSVTAPLDAVVDGRTTAVLVLEPAAQLVVRVADETGLPLQARMSASLGDGSEGEVRLPDGRVGLSRATASGRVLARAGGAQEFRSFTVPAGHLTVRAQAEGHRSAEGSVTTVPGGVHEITLVLSELPPIPERLRNTLVSFDEPAMEFGRLASHISQLTGAPVVVRDPELAVRAVALRTGGPIPGDQALDLLCATVSDVTWRIEKNQYIEIEHRKE